MAKDEEPIGFLPPHGGYQVLRSYRVAKAAYDATVIFCGRWVDRRSRTHDQMVQAARSGVQNIAEGSLASATSKKTEIKLTNVARASLGELLLDYEDFLRQRGMPLWHKDSALARAVRERARDPPPAPDPYDLTHAPPEAAANTVICLIHQAMYLLRRQIERLERDFLEHGGITERMYQARRGARTAPGLGSDKSDRSDRSDRSDSSDSSAAPACPRCGRAMVRRVARQGIHAGTTFWGCAAYPACTGTRTAT